MKLAVSAVVVLTLGVAAQERETSYTPLDFPGAAATTMTGINADGQMVGFYRDAAGKTHGFVRRDQTYVSIDFPDAAWTNARGISASGEVLGAYRMAGEPDVNQHGYRLALDGQFSRIDFPGHVSTVPVRLLPDGTIIGCYHDAAGMDSMHGMTLVKNAFSGFDRATTMHQGATPDGRMIVGYFTDMTDMRRNRGYVLEGTTFTPFDVPTSVSTIAIDISASGAIVGVYEAPAGTTHGFVREGAQYATLDVPGARNTSAWGINSAGTIVGAFVDAGGVTHGFVATRK
jgi:probable HAF family extracellular repeat protein